MASCIHSCVNVSCSPVDHDMLVHLHLHSVLQAETTCQKTGPRLSRNANCQARNERRPNSRHCCGAVSAQYHSYPCCDIPPSFLGQITRRPQPSKVTAAYRLQGGHAFERFMQSSHIWMEKWGIQKRFSQDAKVLLSEFSTWTPLGIVGHIRDLIYFSLRQIG